MATTIYCVPTAKGIHSFYVKQDGKSHFLFNQDYRRGVQAFYAGGVSLSNAINHSSAKGDRAILRTMEKLPVYIKYIEKEYALSIFKRTGGKRKAKCA
ncbi:MAG: hypothetical protein IJ004_00530 [Clostridia bacterium]|nr:hypothetical protein [Clostridia bacterium]